METRDIVVVGASTGGVVALMDFVKPFPPDYQGSIFIVHHIVPYSKTQLPRILSDAGPLEARIPDDGETFQKGRIYIAPNDHHLLLDEDNRMVVKRGPKENRFRPSIDALFRSAAYVYGPRVIGVVLSGLLNDGTSGLWTIKRHGGVAIIQEPDDAEQPEMPKNALEYVEPDFIAAASDMVPIIAGLTKTAAPERYKFSEDELKLLKMEVTIATRDNAFEMGIMNMGEVTPFTCPECHGVFVRLVEGKIIRFRCHTGHAYTASSLLAEVTESVEGMLWQAMRGMEEMSMLMKNISEHFKGLNDDDTATLFMEKGEGAAKGARVIHDSLFELEQYSEDMRFKDSGQ